MGKIRRVRQKLHHSNVKNAANNDSTRKELEEKVNVVDNSQLHKSPMLKSEEELAAMPYNVFAGINISFDDLQNKLTEDDRVSVKSIAKSCKYDSKGKLLTKKEKLKMKHDLFMKKINTIQQLKKEALQKHKKRRAILKANGNQFPMVSPQQASLPFSSGIEVIQNEPTEVKNEPLNKIIGKKTKLKPIKKAKARQKEMLQEISAFRKLLSDPKIMKNPGAVITECVQKRIIKEGKRK